MPSRATNYILSASEIFVHVDEAFDLFLNIISLRFKNCLFLDFQNFVLSIFEQFEQFKIVKKVESG